MRDKESFNYKLVRSSTGRLADEAKREEYEWQMRQKKKTRQGKSKLTKYGTPGPHGGNKGYKKKYKGQGK